MLFTLTIFGAAIGFLAKLLLYFVWYKPRYSGFDSYLRLVLDSLALVSKLGIFLTAVVAIFFMFF